MYLAEGVTLKDGDMFWPNGKIPFTFHLAIRDITGREISNVYIN